MSVSKPRYSKEEFARRGDEIYDRDISPDVEPADEGKFVVIDIETGEYEVDQDELAASDRLLAPQIRCTNVDKTYWIPVCSPLWASVRASGA